MPDIKIRTSDDLAGCIACLKRVYAKDHYPVQGVADAQAFLDGSGIQKAWIAQENSIIIAHLAVSEATDGDLSAAAWWQTHPGAKIAVLGRLFVDPDSRGSGVAAHLIDQAVAWASDQEIRLVLFALEKDRAAARLYERLGWTHFSTQTYHYGDGQHMDAFCFVSPK